MAVSEVVAQVKRLRGQLSQRQRARLLGVSAATVNRIDNATHASAQLDAPIYGRCRCGGWVRLDRPCLKCSLERAA